MNFATALHNESNMTLTENGATALSTTSDSCLDLFSTIGALRSATDSRIETLFADAYAQDPLTATKILFYGRDIREGLGERKTFRTLLRYAACQHPEAISDNIALIGTYGRYDDMYELIDTPLEDKMWSVMKSQLNADRMNMANGQSVSLLAKWIKTPDASSKKTRSMGILTALKLGYSVKDFKKIIRQLRKYIDITEQKMSANDWANIEYSAVPGRATALYKNAFMRHDNARYTQYQNDALTGKAKINSATMYPYDFVKSVVHNRYDDTLEAQWRQLPNYVGKDCNILVMVDVSGSMSGQPMYTSVGLGTYFAERNTGAYHNLFMTFSERPQIVRLRGETLAQKFDNMIDADWGGSTNIEAAFDKILDIAITNHVPSEEMPEALVIISDMEFNEATKNDSWLFYDAMADKYKQNGYEIPDIVFWNVDSRHDTYHADLNRRNVQLLSGQSASTFKTMINSLGTTPMECMRETINSERYAPIKLAS